MPGMMKGIRTGPQDGSENSPTWRRHPGLKRVDALKGSELNNCSQPEDWQGSVHVLPYVDGFLARAYGAACDLMLLSDLHRGMSVLALRVCYISSSQKFSPED